MTRLPLATSVCALVLLLSACSQTPYLVRGEGVPLYVSPSGGETLATLPRFHHEPLDPDDAEAAGARVRIPFRGQIGYAPRRGLELFNYLDPDLDGGDDRRGTIQERLRLAQVDAYGEDWDPAVAEAARAGEIVRGMTPRQVEIAWGWPTRTEPAPSGGQAWIYESERVVPVAVFMAGGWQPCSPYGVGRAFGPGLGGGAGWVT